jgi:hypothetical protein
MTTATNPNGRVRKTLATQLDRLDLILDGLGEGISDAVAMAVQGTMTAAVKEAVQAVLVEALINPALQQRLQKAVQPDTLPAKSSDKTSMFGKVWAWTKDKIRQTGRAVKDASLFVADRAKKNWVAAAGVVGVVVYAARSRIASAAATVCGWFRGLGAIVGSGLGRVFPSFACCET